MYHLTDDWKQLLGELTDHAIPSSGFLALASSDFLKALVMFFRSFNSLCY